MLKRVLRLATHCLLLVALVVTPAQGQAEAFEPGEIGKGQIYEIRSANGHVSCLTGKIDTLTNGAPAHIQPCLDETAQKWQFVEQGDDQFMLVTLQGSTQWETGCLDAPGAADLWNEGASVQLNLCHNRSTQLWRITADGSYFKMISAVSNKCLQTFSEKGAGAVLDHLGLGDCSDSDRQKWLLKALSPCMDGALCSNHGHCGTTTSEGVCNQFAGSYGTCICFGTSPCGNGVCEAHLGENYVTCPADCLNLCGNGVCGPDENHRTCPKDCPMCGDGFCDQRAGENHVNCPSDCSSPCGDGLCQAWAEDCVSCQQDCGVCSCVQGATCSNHTDCGGTSLGFCNQYGGGYGTCVCPN